MSERKKHRRAQSTVHGVTDRGIEMSPGRFVPAPEIAQTPDGVQRVRRRGGYLYGYFCGTCLRDVVRSNWTEQVAQEAYDKHRKAVHPS